MIATYIPQKLMFNLLPQVIKNAQVNIKLITFNSISDDTDKEDRFSKLLF